MIRKVIIDMIVFVHLVLFVYAAITKLMNLEKFYIQLSQSPMLSSHASMIAYVVPALELLISILMIFERSRLPGLHGAFGMMVIFTTYIVLASRFSDYTPCSCGGVIESLTWSQHLVLNLVFMLLGGAAILLYPQLNILAHNKIRGSR